MTFVSTSNFRYSYNLLKKRTENGYSNCLIDICNELKGLSFDDIFTKHFLLMESKNFRVIKLRIKNSNQNLSSAAGYRVIIICNTNHNHVAFLEIFPKRGKYSRSDLTGDEYKNIMNNYGSESKNEALITHDINNELADISKKASS